MADPKVEAGVAQALTTNQKVLTIKDVLEKRRDTLAQVIPGHLNADRLLKVALNCVSKTPALQDCTPLSLLQCVVQAAELGLEPGSALGHAYLVPFGQVCTLIIGYRGFIELMRRSGELAAIRAVVVFEKDKFRPFEGLEQGIEHVPFIDGDAGPLKHVYCVAKLKDGTIQTERMTRAQVDKVRARSRSANNGPWVTDYEEMAKKTVVRRIAKYLPMSPELATAYEKALDVEATDYIEADAQDVGRSLAAQTTESATEKAKAKVKKRIEIVDEVPETHAPMTDAEKAAIVSAEKEQAKP